MKNPYIRRFIRPFSGFLALIACGPLWSLPDAQTIHETGQQYKEGNALTSFGDNSAIGSQIDVFKKDTPHGGLDGRSGLINLDNNLLFRLRHRTDGK